MPITLNIQHHTALLSVQYGVMMCALDQEKGNLTHNAVCSVCGRCAGSRAVVVRTVVAMESGHRRKTGINLSRGVRWVTLSKNIK